MNDSEFVARAARIIDSDAWTLSVEDYRDEYCYDLTSAARAEQNRARIQSLRTAQLLLPFVADAWNEGATAALLYSVRQEDGITLKLDHPNPYGS